MLWNIPFALLTGEGWWNSPANTHVCREGGNRLFLQQDLPQLFQHWFCARQVSAKNWHTLRLLGWPAISYLLHSSIIFISLRAKRQIWRLMGYMLTCKSPSATRNWWKGWWGGCKRIYSWFNSPSLQLSLLQKQQFGSHLLSIAPLY